MECAKVNQNGRSFQTTLADIELSAAVGLPNVRFRATASPPQPATLGAKQTSRISAELGRVRRVWFLGGHQFWPCERTPPVAKSSKRELSKEPQP